MKIIILVLTYLDNDVYSKFYQKQNETWNSIKVNGVDVFFNINNGDKKEINSHFIINDLPPLSLYKQLKPNSITWFSSKALTVSLPK